MPISAPTPEGAERQREEARRLASRLTAEGFHAEVIARRDGSYACLIWSPLRAGETEARE